MPKRPHAPPHHVAHMADQSSLVLRMRHHSCMPAALPHAQACLTAACMAGCLYLSILGDDAEGVVSREGLQRSLSSSPVLRSLF